MNITLFPEDDAQIFNGPSQTSRVQKICSSPVAPDTGRDGSHWIDLQLGLRQQAAKVAGQQITAPTLGQARIARTIDQQPPRSLSY